MDQLDSLTEFKRRRIGTVLCEWGEETPPAAVLAQFFSQAQVVAFSARFDRDALAASRQKGFTEHFFLPLPENFFEEMERSEPRGSARSHPAQCAVMLELLEKRRDYGSICHYVAETILDLLPGVSWSIQIQDKDHHWKTLLASASWTVERNRLLSCLQRFTQEEPSSQRVQAGLQWEDLVCVPMIKDGAVGGAICCQRRDGDVAHYVPLLKDVALFLGVAFHHVDMLIEKERLTFADPLTSLYNYRYLRQFLVNEIRRCSRYNKSVSILFIDIDWFKAVNDNHGHMAGSDTLVEIGRQFSSMVRESDIVVRYGGDEFVVVLTETNPSGATSIAERVRRAVESHVFGADKGRDIRITVSIGISGYPDNGFSVDELIRKADGAMYEAKNLHKNLVRVAG